MATLDICSEEEVVAYFFGSPAYVVMTLKWVVYKELLLKILVTTSQIQTVE